MKLPAKSSSIRSSGRARAIEQLSNTSLVLLCIGERVILQLYGEIIATFRAPQRGKLMGREKKHN
jgi:hypothetical protein